MVGTAVTVWLLGQVVLGRADTPPMPSSAAIGTWGMNAFSAHQESELLHRFAEYENLVLASLAPGHGLREDVFALVRDHAGSRAPLAAMLHGWAEGKVIAPAPRDGLRTWGPPSVVDSLVARDRATAAAWLASLETEPGTVPAEAAPERLAEPSFPDAPCGSPGAGAAAKDTGTVAGVARSVDGVLVQTCGVFLPALEKVVLTDAAGRFEFCDVPAGTHDLKATHISHHDVSGTITVRPGEVTRVEILLYAPQD